MWDILDVEYLANKIIIESMGERLFPGNLVIDGKDKETREIHGLATTDNLVDQVRPLNLDNDGRPDYPSDLRVDQSAVQPNTNGSESH